MTERGNEGGGRRWWSARRLFDDRSRYLDRFGLLLVVTMAGIVVLSLVDLREEAGSIRADLSAMAATVVVVLTLVLALRASGAARRLRRVAEVVGAVGIAAILVVTVLDATGDAELSIERAAGPSWFWVVLSMLAPVAVVRRLFQHRRVARGTLLGAISAYLLLALSFDLLFLAIDGVQSEPFFGQDEPTTSFMYFSLTTITTLGYGDLAAVSPVGRLAATVEAVIGQVFLVTFVAALVGLFVQDHGTPSTMLRMRGQAPDGGGEGSGDPVGREAGTSDDDGGGGAVGDEGMASGAP